ncbi:MAG: phosphoenolpyruvate synthase, partial [Candidatus Sericytochromatia bacterium]|nr:phosphoenolpyruvate synthase [Candidatus Tanganyikabacteria bacterium]
DCFAWVEGRATCVNLRGLVALRRAEFASFEDLPISDRMETVGPVYYGDQLYVPPVDTGEDDGPVLQGTSCCPGRVAAKARIILKPSDDLRLQGEILVTERTDPGWVPLYPSASGLLIERGSLLSHAAVVARELGLPTIIGIRNLIKRVQDGQWVDMDGRSGQVRLDGEGDVSGSAGPAQEVVA